ncbi:sugar ABC transporter ATP-binding protein [Blautia obeum]|uniref:Ribose import ATP-binding protein RbsA n=1 Tax=Blautia obeum TaxID=40520 RepID=A0A564S9W4_9FIRM|nr:sugar ABC transporter ATP-binding protein [Blautia obeum]VUW91538.1 Ribose import ATP-binding protein RbsA [Blautia obeum]
MTSQTIVKMEGISKAFAGIKALDNVQIDLRKGEIHALMGENGAGKSTLMKIMTGVYTRDSGKMYLQNQSLNQLEEVEIKSPLVGQKLGLSMVFQEFNLLENMNIAENIFIGREPLGVGQTVDKKQLLQNAVEELKKVNLDIDPNTEVSKLSCGQKQCVEIAKALSFNARVVVFDEPTASLSEKESQTLFKLIKELKAKGVCIVYISHRMEEVFELSDRITVFRNGKYIDTVSTKDVQEKDIISMMIGHELNIEKKSGSEFVNKDKVVLEVKNVEVFPGAKSVNFKLYEKEILGFFGLVGAGRTELARVIFGVDSIGSGEIYVEGGKVKISSPKDAIQAGIGLVPEDRKGLGLILGMSIKDNMLISKIGQFKSSLLNKKALKNITGTFISDLGISLRNEEQEVKELSGGNQQKVVIAKWLAMKPNILIMDEPTRGIDIGAKSEIYALMRKMTEQGMSIIMISSEMSEVMQVSDRILVMHEGSISGELTAEEVTRNNIMQAAFGGVNE